ncbi:MAG: transporter, partial [Gemmobacter sp.]
MRQMLAAGAASVIMAVAPAAQSETLADALIAAYKNSHLLDQNRALLRAADEDVATSVAALRPVVNFVASASKQVRSVQQVPTNTIIENGSL